MRIPPRPRGASRALPALLLLCASGIVWSDGGVVVPETAFDFGRVVRGEVVEHEFVLRNDGRSPVRITRAIMTPPLLVTRMPGVLEAGATAGIAARLDTAQLQGAFPGELIVELEGARQIALSFEGEVVGSVEVAPMSALFIAGQRGQRAQGTVELINHEAEPLQILAIEHPPEAFATMLETLVPGGRYRLTVELRPDGPGGRRSDVILVRTSSRTTPLIRIGAHTNLRDRVHVFPDAVELGSFGIGQVRSDPGLLGRLAQTLMVYQSEGTDFRVHLDSDVRGLMLAAERGPQHDRYQLTVQLTPHELSVGEVEGSIRIRTNDPEFPELLVPVHGRITEP
jgi:hypothetical protein